MDPGICCDEMRQQVERQCPDHPDAHDCPDSLVGRRANGSFGLLIHDGGSSFVRILYCPWCGSDVTKDE